MTMRLTNRGPTATALFERLVTLGANKKQFAVGVKVLLQICLFEPSERVHGFSSLRFQDVY